MNKAELIEAIAAQADLTKADAARALDALTSTIAKTLSKGEPVAIPGFGSFERRTRNARTGINPRTREAIKIPATQVPAFKAGKQFKDTVKK